MTQGAIQVTVIGNLTDDPELRFTQAGTPVARLSIAVNPRIYSREAGEWVDGEASFVRVTVWRQLAENVAESLSRGDRVIAHGTFAESRWEDREGAKRSAWQLTANAVGPDLTFATARPAKVGRRAGEVPPDDPWAGASESRPDEAGEHQAGEHQAGEHQAGEADQAGNGKARSTRSTRSRGKASAARAAGE